MSGTVFHGGGLGAAMARHGGKAEDWIDLSTGISPVGYPFEAPDGALWQRLPDEALEDLCREAARAAYGAGEGTHISLAPGSQTHIQLLPLLFKPQDVAIVGFTYQEHGHCWQRAGHQVFVCDGLESAEATARIVIVVNPNNPDGAKHDPQALLALQRRLRARGGLLVVDEAFGDVVPELSVASAACAEGLVVLRSFGKFFGLAGLRLGFALCGPQLGERLDGLIGPWAVSGPALEIGASALADRKWQARARRRIGELRSLLSQTLTKNGLEETGGTPLFAFVIHPQAESIAGLLAVRHILVRPFPAKKDWLRLGLPASRPQSRRIEKALTEVMAVIGKGTIR